MKILVVADEVVKKFYDYYEDGMFKQYDLILSCGDLPPQYLSFLVTMSGRDVLYVHGNHDDCYKMTPPEGCISVEDRIFTYKGLRILGLGGSQKYKDGINMYTEKEMQRRIRRLGFSLRRHKGFDILLTHAPIQGLGDGEDLPHKGFASFRTLIEKYQPEYMIHGHQHKTYGKGYQKECALGDTKIINAFGYYVLDIPD